MRGVRSGHVPFRSHYVPNGCGEPSESKNQPTRLSGSSSSEPPPSTSDLVNLALNASANEAATSTSTWRFRTVMLTGWASEKGATRMKHVTFGFPKTFNPSRLQTPNDSLYGANAWFICANRYTIVQVLSSGESDELKWIPTHPIMFWSGILAKFAAKFSVLLTVPTIKEERYIFYGIKVRHRIRSVPFLNIPRVLPCSTTLTLKFERDRRGPRHRRADQNY